MPAFNLVDEPWMTPRWCDGTSTPASLRDVLLRSDDIDTLIVDLSTQLPALLRQVVLPVVLDAIGPPHDRAEWAARFKAGRFSAQEREQLDRYLGEHRPRFDLFDAEQPFAQVAGLRTAKGETKGSGLLVATAATGNNVPLFASRTEGDPLELTPAQAARWLLHTMCWDTAAIKTGAVGDPQAKAGKTTGNPTGPLGQLGVVMPMGTTLYETLLLNLPIGSQIKSGTPHWRREPADATWTTKAPDGLLDLWTWQSRRVRLITQETPDGVRVTRVVLSAGDRLNATPEWEPHTAWNLPKATKASKNVKGDQVRRPRRHMPGKAIWRGLDALLVSEEGTDTATETSVLLDQLAGLQEDGKVPDDYPLRVETFGVSYGNQSAVVEDVIHDAIPLPITALRKDSAAYRIVLEATGQAENLARAVNNLSADLRRAIGADPIPWDKGQRPGELVLHALDPLVRRLLAGVRTAGGDEEVLARGQLAWEELAYRTTWQVAVLLLAAAPPEAFAGREMTNNGKTVTYRLGTAESGFRRQVNQVLSRAAAAHADKRRRDAETGAALSTPGV